MLTGLLITTLIALLCAIGCAYKDATTDYHDDKKTMWGIFSAAFIFIFIILFSASFIHINSIISNQLNVQCYEKSIEEK